MTPHRVLPFILAIPLLLLFVAFSTEAVDAGFVSVTLQYVPRGLHRTPVPSPWEDDVFTDGIPPVFAGDDLTRRKARPSRIIPRDERTGRTLPLRTGTGGPRLVLIETLLDAFLIGLPPPVMGPGA
jgi:hypothetical protein